MDLNRFRVLTFDCYGTLIDWEAGILAELLPWARRAQSELGAPDLLAAYGEEEARLEAESPAALYPEILAQTMRALGRRFGLAVADAEARAFARSIRDWPAFADSAEALARLKSRFALGILSNVDRESFRHSNARLGVEFDLVLTAQDVGAYKPAPAHFTAALAALAERGIGKDAVLHVAQSLYHDHVPAKALGLATVWIDRHAGRGGGITTAPAVRPDLTLPSLAALADRLCG